MNRVKITDPTTGNVYNETGLSLLPERWSYDSEVGFYDAMVRVEGRVDDLYTVVGWLGNKIEIQNKNGTGVWEGKIMDVTINVGNATIGVSLKSMYNKVRVLYTTSEESGSLSNQMTSWFSNLNSQQKYGVKELIFTQSNLDTTAADTLASTLVNTLGTPRGEMSFERTEYFATLRCEGLLNTLAWKYHLDETGFEGSTVGSAEQTLGLAFTSIQTGFNAFSGLMASIDGYFKNFSSNTRVRVSGSASNNGTKLITGVARIDPLSYVSPGIYFDPTNDMHDGSLGLDVLRTGQLIKITGSVGAVNDGLYWATSVSEDHVELSPADIVTSAAASTTINQGNSVSVQETLVNEITTSPVTVTAHGSKMYYSFQIASPVAWTVTDVFLRLKKNGAPVDNIQVSLIQMTGTDTYTVLTSTTKAGSIITTEFNPYKFTMPAPQTLSVGVTYGILIERTGSNHPDNFYIVAVDEDQSHGGTLRLYDGAGWNDRYDQADLWFSIQGVKSTTQQMSEILTQHGSHISAYAFEESSSGISTAQYMTKEEIALERFKKLLRHGNSSNKRYVIESFVGGAIKVAVQKVPDAQNFVYHVSSDGTIMEGQDQPLEEGRLLQNEVVEVSLDVIPNGTFLLTNRFNVGFSEWDEGQRRLNVTPVSASGSRIVDSVANR